MDEIWTCGCGIEHHVNTRLKGSYSCPYGCNQKYGDAIADNQAVAAPVSSEPTVAASVEVENNG